MHISEQMFDQQPLELIRSQQNSGKETIHLLHFRAGRLSICIELEHVIQVMHIIAMQPLPGAPEYVVGVMNFHGRMAPTIDLSKRLGIPDKQKYSLDTPMIFCRYQNRSAGIIVSEICSLINIPSSALQIKELLYEIGVPFSAALQLDDGPAVLLNLISILDIDSDLNTADIANKLRNFQRNENISGK